MINESELRRMLFRVPHPPGEPIPEGISDQVCDDFVKRTGITLPEDLRMWLKISNGPCVGPGGLFGIQPRRMHLDMEASVEAYPLWKERGWIAVGGDGCGDYYVIATRQEFGHGYPILFIDCASDCSSPAYIVASDLGHFLTFLLQKELAPSKWPFDREMVLGADPDIARFSGVALPWG